MKDDKMNDKKLEWLVIEDKESHLQDAMRFFEERMSSGVPLSIEYASTLDEAMKRLSRKSYDGIMTDIFFPVKDGEPESENGTRVGTYALERKIPFVVVTSTYHHGHKTEPVNKWARSKGFELIDCYSEEKNAESEQKDWRAAYIALAYLTEGIKNGTLPIGREGIGGSFRGLCNLARNVKAYERYGELQEMIESRIKGDGDGDGDSQPDRTLGLTVKKYCKGLFPFNLSEDKQLKRK